MKSTKNKGEVKDMIGIIEENILDSERVSEMVSFGEDESPLILVSEDEKRGARKALYWVMDTVVPDNKIKAPNEKLQKFGIQDPVKVKK